MKRILITGANSYIGAFFEKYIEQWQDRYQVGTVDMIDQSWRALSFAGYDTVFHVAGIAHSDSGRTCEQDAALYYQVNTDLTLKVAKKAKTEGVQQFIFMSSIIVYGNSAPIGQRRVITKDTIPAPINAYGDSKLQAEKGLEALNHHGFQVAILRPPMIYGKGCKGNYPLLARCATMLPAFPEVNNLRSVLYIENLCEFVRLLIDDGGAGIYYPQNKEQVSTGEIVRGIAQAHGRKILLVKGCAGVLQAAALLYRYIGKAFGSLCIDPQLSVYAKEYQNISFMESIRKTEAV